ncbi:MAG: hypothetical protein ACI97A_002068 [Planctomycetota bacterium]|jgi:hypothetical protein
MSLQLRKEIPIKHLQRLTLLTGSGIGLIALFVPWATIYTSGSIFQGSDTVIMIQEEGEQLFPLIAFLFCGALAFLGDRTKPIKKWATIVTGMIGLLFAGWCIFVISQQTNSEQETTTGLGIHRMRIELELGIYLFAVAGFIIFVSAFLTGRK